MQPKNFLRILLGTAGILLIPFVAMQFAAGVNWSVFDFILAGTLLLGMGFAYELLTSKAGHPTEKIAVALAVGTGLLLIWVNLAVGIIGGEGNPANLMYLGVLAVGFVGAVIARFQPHGMARAMFATALTHALVTVYALVAGVMPANGMTLVLAANALFVALWTGSGLLFRTREAYGSR